MKDIVGIFLPSLKGGGAERSMLHLARGLQDHVVVDFIVMSREDVWPVPESIEVLTLGVRRSSGSIFRLARYLRERRPVALIANLFHANLAAVLARLAARSDIRLILVNQNPLSAIASSEGIRNRAMPLLVRTLYPLADVVVAISKGTAKDIARVARLKPEMIRVVYNPAVDPDLFELAKSPVSHPFLDGAGPPVVLGVGALNRQKDFATLIHAFALVQKERSLRLLILGEGGLRVALEQQIRDLGLERYTSLPGFVPNPYPYMARASVFALSSLWEGLGGALVEALALGTPVVATDCVGGPSEVLEGGKWGRLVEVGDPGALAHAILETLDRPVIPPREAWQRFSIEEATTHYLNLIYKD